jgi:hypothetical protein
MWPILRQAQDEAATDTVACSAAIPGDNPELAAALGQVLVQHRRATAELLESLSRTRQGSARPAAGRPLRPVKGFFRLQ